jgi:long-chain acyl-CoA synthetase
MSADTLPGLLLERAAATPNAVALRYFRLGKWNDVTFAQLKEKAASIGSGLAGHGIGKGDVVAVISEDGPLCFAAELGAQGIGAKVLAVAPDLVADEVLHVIRDAGAVCVIAGDQEQFDKVDESRAEVPAVRLVVVDATRGLRHLDVANRDDRDRTLTVAQLASHSVSSGWDASAKAAAGSDGARVVGANTMNHASVLSEAQGLISRLSLTGRDVLCALQPFADPTEHALSVAGPLLSGSVLHFRGRATAQQAMRQVQPTIVHATPQWLGRISADADAQTARAGGVKKVALGSGLRRQPPSNSLRTARRVPLLRLVGVGVVALILCLFLVTAKANDVVRLLLAIAIVLAACAGLVLAGHAIAGPLRRRYGLSRCRAVLTTDGTDLPGADLLGALDIPLIDTAREVLS